MPHQSLPARQPSRRHLLGLLGAAPLAATGVLAGSSTAHAANGAGPFETSSVPKGLRPGGEYDKLIAQMAAEDKFSGTVLLARRGKTVLARSYGMADKEQSLANEIDTIFALASASKPFTALAILQLAQQGKIDFYGTLGTYLDGFPAAIASTVTIHHLLTHTSGMGDLLTNAEFMDKAGTWTSAAEVMDETLRIIGKEPLQFTPGTGNRYSNNGYDTLGAVVARVSGKSFYDYVRDHIFNPAGMTRSGFYTRSQWLADKRIAHPYTLESSGNRADALRAGIGAARMFIGTGGGNGFSTAGDLVRFANALQRGKLLNPAYTELFMSPKFPNRPRGVADPAVRSFTAYGAPAPVHNNHLLFGHGGGAAGESANWTIYRDLDWTGVILSNYDQIDLETIISRERNLITGRA